MAFSPVIAVCDACILYPFHLRNIIVQTAVDRLFHARWSEQIHDEWLSNLVANVPGLSADHLDTAKRLMNTALPAATITEYEKHIPAVTLPDPDDRHVVAVAIEAEASHILTWNLRDFPIMALKKHGLVRQTPDTFLTDLYDLSPQLILGSLANARRNLSKSAMSAAAFHDMLRGQKLRQLHDRLRGHIGDL
ncbi:PIN domain-containing protein [Roseicella sp. DB1501]|uniref:PIN domain-containing protein n=1 Tax=Roseicella sp. DB1501 TaxID=2730925 RepID=UPI001490BCF5|nr:PIN domain-containing protein [Roseicella sp. DB1501]NOG70854.1 PIN domain-containing protein [Roseicella sp. DB1501]